MSGWLSRFFGGQSAAPPLPADSDVKHRNDDSLASPTSAGAAVLRRGGLDLTEVFPRLFVAGMPYNAVSARDAHRNNIGELASHLDKAFGPGQYLVVNLAHADKANYDEGRFHEQVAKFPPVIMDSEASFDDGMPTVAESFRICYVLAFWLAVDATRVAVLHDVNGRTRSAFVISCFMAWAAPREWTAPGAYHTFCEKRSSRFQLPPAWWQSLVAFQTCAQMPQATRPRKLQLMKVVASMTGQVQRLQRDPVLRVYQEGEVIFDSEIDCEDSEPYVGDDMATSGMGFGLSDGSSSGSGAGGIARSSSGRAGGRYGDAFVFDEGELKCEVNRFVEGDVQIYIFADTVTARPMRLFPTPAGDVPDVGSLALADEDTMEETHRRIVVVRAAFHTDLMPAEAVMSIPANASKVDLPSREWVQGESFRLTVSFADPAAGGAMSPSGPAAVSGHTGASSAVGIASDGSAAGAAKTDLHPLDIGSTAAAAALLDSENDLIVKADGRLQWDFAQCLNLTGARAQLAGMFHLASAHQVMPEASGVEFVLADAGVGTREPLFAAVALQLVQRNRERAVWLLKQDFFQRLIALTRQTTVGIPRRIGLGDSALRAADVLALASAASVGSSSSSGVSGPHSGVGSDVRLFRAASGSGAAGAGGAGGLLSPTSSVDSSEAASLLSPQSVGSGPRSSGAGLRLGSGGAGSRHGSFSSVGPAGTVSRARAKSGQHYSGVVGIAGGNRGPSSSFSRERSGSSLLRRFSTASQLGAALDSDAASDGGGSEGDPGSDAETRDVLSGPVAQLMVPVVVTALTNLALKLEQARAGAAAAATAAGSASATPGRSARASLPAASPGAVGGGSARRSTRLSSPMISLLPLGSGHSATAEGGHDGAAASKPPLHSPSGAYGRDMAHLHGHDGDGPGSLTSPSATASIDTQIALHEAAHGFLLRNVAALQAVVDGVSRSSSSSDARDTPKAGLAASSADAEELSSPRDTSSTVPATAHGAHRLRREESSSSGAKLCVPIPEDGGGDVKAGEDPLIGDHRKHGVISPSSLAESQRQQQLQAKQQDRKRSSSSVDGRSIDPEMRAALAAAVQSDLMSRRDPLLYAAALQVVTAILHAERTELAPHGQSKSATTSAAASPASGSPAAKQASSSAAADKQAVAVQGDSGRFGFPPDSTVGSQPHPRSRAPSNTGMSASAAASVASALEARSDVVAGFARLDVHGMMLLLEAVRLVLAAGAVPPIVLCPELALPSDLGAVDSPSASAAGRHGDGDGAHASSTTAAAAAAAATVSVSAEPTHAALSSPGGAIMAAARATVRSTSWLLPRLGISLSVQVPTGPAADAGAAMSASSSATGQASPAEVNERAQHRLARAVQLVSSLLTQNKQLSAIYASLASQLEGNLSLGTQAQPPKRAAGLAYGTGNQSGVSITVGAGKAHAASADHGEAGAAVPMTAFLSGTAGGASGATATTGDSKAGAPAPPSAGAPSAQALLALGLTAEQVVALTQLLNAQQQHAQASPAGQHAAALGPAGATSDAVALLLPLLASLAQKHISASAAVEQPLDASASTAAAPAVSASAIGASKDSAAAVSAVEVSSTGSAAAASSTAGPELAPTVALPSPVASPAQATADDATLDLGRFARMLKMGVPLPAVQQKMRGEGVDPDRHWDALMRLVNGGGSGASASAASPTSTLEGSPASDAASAASPAAGAAGKSDAAAESKDALADSAPAPAAAVHGIPADVLSKFERMLKMGIPPAAVQHKMRGDGLADVPAAQALLELCKRLGKPIDSIVIPDGMPGGPDAAADPAAGSGPADGDAAAKAEWAARKAARKAAADAAAAEAAAAAAEAAASKEREAAEARALDEERRRRVAELLQEQLDVAAELSAPLKDTKRYGPFFYMRRVGVPTPVIEHKMVMAGLDPSILRQDEAQPLQGVAVVPLREDMAYSRYFAMVRMGVPRDAVLHKMRGDGANALALELNPDLPAPPGLADLAAGLVLSPHTRQQIAAQYAAVASQAGADAARPRRQRKKLHWETRGIGAGKQTIWGRGSSGGADGASDGEGLDSLIDDAELAALFTQDASAGRAGAGSAKGGSKGSGSSDAKVIYLLDMKRGRNVGIGVRKIKMPAEALRRCLLGLTRGVDGYALSLEELTLLEELLPSADEATLVRAFRGDRSRLGEAEKFFLAVADVPKPRARAGALAFQQTFDAADAALATAVATVVTACEQLRTSQRLRRVLEAALLIGNRLNTADDDELMGGSSTPGNSTPGSSTPSSAASSAASGGAPRGGAGGGGGGASAAGARAIAVSSLLKLGQTKAYTSSKLTLLHYVAARLRRVSTDPASMAVAEELPSLPAAARLSVELLRADLAALKSGLSSVEALVREQVRHDAHAAAAAASASARARAGSTLLLGSTGAGVAASLGGRGASSSVSEPSDAGSGGAGSAGSASAGSAAAAVVAGGSPVSHTRRASRASYTATGGPGSPSSSRSAAAGGAGGAASAAGGAGGGAPRVRLGSYLEEVAGLGAAVDDALASTADPPASSTSPTGASESGAAAAAGASSVPHHENLGDFVARAQSRLAALAAAVDGAASSFATTLDFFGEDPGSMSVESFCGTLHAFVGAFQRADAENLADEAKKAREARRAASGGSGVGASRTASSVGSPGAVPLSRSVSAASADGATGSGRSESAGSTSAAADAAVASPAAAGQGRSPSNDTAAAPSPAAAVSPAAISPQPRTSPEAAAAVASPAVSPPAATLDPRAALMAMLAARKSADSL